MGRHSSDPLGIARLVLVGLGVLVLVALIALGVFSLIGSLSSGAEQAPSPAPAAVAPPSGDTPASAASAQVPTVLLECVRRNCPTVFVKITGGDVLLDRDLAQGERFQSFDPKVDVVLADSASVRVQVNGTARSPGPAGERAEFTVSRE